MYVDLAVSILAYETGTDPAVLRTYPMRDLTLMVNYHQSGKHPYRK